jgi:hypothetical protein
MNTLIVCVRHARYHCGRSSTRSILPLAISPLAQQENEQIGDYAGTNLLPQNQHPRPVSKLGWCNAPTMNGTLLSTRGVVVMRCPDERVLVLRQPPLPRGKVWSRPHYYSIVIILLFAF